MDLLVNCELMSCSNLSNPRKGSLMVQKPGFGVSAALSWRFLAKQISNKSRQIVGKAQASFKQHFSLGKTPCELKGTDTKAQGSRLIHTESLPSSPWYSLIHQMTSSKVHFYPNWPVYPWSSHSSWTHCSLWHSVFSALWVFLFFPWRSQNVKIKHAKGRAFLQQNLLEREWTVS